MKRNKHSLSHYKLLTADMGKLVPIGLMEAVPGDTFQQSTSLLIRMQPMLAPVMHPVTVRVHHWFVPTRLLWPDAFEDFITGGPDGTGTAEDYPTNSGTYTVNAGTLGDYFGLPTGVAFLDGQISMLPFRAYNMIYNEWYRDQDLITELAEDQDTVPFCAWEKDYFTRSRPWAQKGPSVSIPIGGSAPVIGESANARPQYRDQDGNLRTIDSISSSQNVQLNAAAGSTAGELEWNDPQLVADLTNATSADVRDVRLAFALQRYQEARAQYGSRYTEYLRYLGIRPSDARLQRPEYLGGGKQTIAFSEVLRTGSNEDAATTEPIGQLRGHGIAAMRTNRYRYFCEEHGFILSLMSVRPRTMYQNGINRLWSRRTKESYYQRELELIGQQEIENGEIYAQGTTADADTFGFNDRYSEYRHQHSGVCGEFRALLDYWHLGRKFSSLPTLNQSFVDCDPDKRIFAEQTQNSMWIMANHSVQARRILGKRTIGKII